MRIVHESPDLLIVAERAVGLRVCGAVLGVTGAALVVMAVKGEGIPAGFAGACILLVGAMFALLPVTSSFSFDRLEQRFVVSRRHVWSRGKTGVAQFRLRDITAVRTEKFRVPGDAEDTWRVIIRLADGRTIPFESYSTSGYASKAALASRIAGFLAVESPKNSAVRHIPLFG
jgi:hypothetical protein